MASIKKTTLLFFFLLSILISSCVDGKTKAGSDVPPQNISISLSPSATSLPTGGTLVFTASVKGTTPPGTGNSTVTWRVDEGAVGGHITSKKENKDTSKGISKVLYTAPATAGIFHITTQSQVDSTKSASASITISTALDATFGQNGKVQTGLSRNAEIKALARQSDGKTIVGGFALNGEKNSFALARYLSDGSLDTSFGKAGIALTPLNNSQITALAIQADGRILAAGFAQGGFDSINKVAINAFALVRYLSDGRIDTGFGSRKSGIVTKVFDGSSEIYALKLLPGGNILVAGSVFNTQTQDKNFALARYLPDGNLDLSFGVSGIATTDTSGNDDIIRAMLIQTDGKIVIGGVSSTGASKGDFALARYSANGVLDLSFGTLGITTTDVSGGNEDQINALALQADGTIAAGGLSFNGTNNDFALLRYTADGKTVLSTTVTDVGAGNNDQINDLSIQNGTILAGGFASNGTDNDFALVRYTASGALDASFGTSGIVTTAIGSGNDQANGFVLQSSGKILVAGSAVTGTRSDFALAQYSTAGLLDGTFGLAGKVTTPVGGGNDEINGLAIHQAGVDQDKIVAAGFSGSDFALARYTQNGGLDLSFSGDGLVNTAIGSGAGKRDRGNAVAIYQSGVNQGKIVVGGVSYNGTDDDFALVRYNADGSPDTTFGTSANGIVTTPITSAVLGNEDAVNTLVLQADGKIIAAGTGAVAFGVADTRQDFALVRYNANGTLDTTFDTDGKLTTRVGPDPDLDPDLGPSLNLDPGPSFAEASVIQADGKILVAGEASKVKRPVPGAAPTADFDFALVRYLTNGALDAGFGKAGIVITPISGGGEDIVEAMTLQLDGKILVAGGALTGDSAGKFIVVRYNPDGGLDSAFGTNGVVMTDLGLESRATALRIQADGKILAAGFSFSAQNKRDFALVRYNSDGSLDAGFGVGGIEISPFSANVDEIHSLALQSDGKIVAGGTLLGDSGLNADFHLARYKP